MKHTVAAVEEMAAKLAADGQRTPATGFVDGEDVVLIDGMTRWKGGQNLGWATLRVLIQEPPHDVRDLYEKAFSANSDRSNHTPLDNAIRWKELLEEGTYASQAEISRRLHVHESEVSRTLQLLDLPQRVVQAALEFPSVMTLRMLTSIRGYCQVHGEDKTLELIFDVVHKGWGYRDVDLRTKAGTSPIKRPRSEKLPFHYSGVRGELRLFADEGRVELSIKGLADADAAKLQQTLKEILARD